MKRYRIPLLLLPPFAALVLALALSLLAPWTGSAAGPPVPASDAPLMLTGTGALLKDEANSLGL